METRLRRASHPDKELAYGEQNIHTTGVRPDKELAYGEQNIRTTGVLRIETRLRRAITQALRA